MPEPFVERTPRITGVPSRYGDLIDAVARFGDEAACQGDAWHEFVTAVAEIAGNILSYAYAGRESGEVVLSLRRYPDRIEAHFRDWGMPVVEPDPVPPDAEDLEMILELAERGRGLSLARAALDRLEYDRTESGENRWQLTKLI
ncbi:MAG: ATP-binding protein [Thermomicrobiales bacterium]|nr:ATP-binding protein [Thermomicrobiales bacterium]